MENKKCKILENGKLEFCDKMMSEIQKNAGYFYPAYGKILYSTGSKEDGYIEAVMFFRNQIDYEDGGETIDVCPFCGEMIFDLENYIKRRKELGNW